MNATYKQKLNRTLICIIDEACKVGDTKLIQNILSFGDEYIFDDTDNDSIYYSFDTACYHDQIDVMKLFLSLTGSKALPVEYFCFAIETIGEGGSSKYIDFLFKFIGKKYEIDTSKYFQRALISIQTYRLKKYNHIQSFLDLRGKYTVYPAIDDYYIFPWLKAMVKQRQRCIIGYWYNARRGDARGNGQIYGVFRGLPRVFFAELILQLEPKR